MDEPLSVTTWPPRGQLPMPELERYPDAALEGDFIYLGNHHERAEAPPELYLRQASRLDPTNPGPVALEVARTVGGLSDWGEGNRPARDIAGDDPDVVRARFSARHGRRYERVKIETGRGFRVHVDEIAYRLRVLYVLGRHVVAYSRGDYLAHAWEGLLDPPRQLRAEREAWIVFNDFISPALRAFHARVLIQYPGGPALGAPEHEGVTFLEAGALQIRNDLARHADYFTCPNCGLIFARQVGESTHYSRSTGVTYCTPKCATAARVKAYRARKRAERAQR